MPHPSKRSRRSVPSRSGCYSICREEGPDRDGAFESLDELVEAFPTEAACSGFLESLRFPRGFVCPGCECRERPWRTGMGLLACPACRQPWVLTEGTMFHGSRIPLARWFTAIWSWLEHEDGLDAASFGHLLGIDDAAQARDYLAKLRALMGTADATRLHGEVRLAMAKVQLRPDDERLTPLILALEHQVSGEPRLRLRSLGRASAGEVMRFAADTIEPGSLVVTPPWKGFGDLSRFGLLHTMRASAVDGSRSVDPSQIWSLVRLWLWSQPSCRVDPTSLVDELAFRFNHRHLGTGAAWQRLMTTMVASAGASPRPLEAVG